MTQEQLSFMHLVQRVLRQHPDWMADTLTAIQAGVSAALDDERTARVNAEASLIVAYEAGKAKIPAHQRAMVETAIINSKFVGGTPYTEKLAQRQKP